jgi:hypothetical protein
MPAQSDNKQNYLVFISHSTKDHWIAKQMAHLIEEKGRRLGVRVFLDAKDIEGGDSISEVIREHLLSCNELMVLMSRYSVDRPWVLIEMGAAWVLGKRIVAVTDKVSPEEMPDIVAPHKAMDINSFDDYLEQLLKRAKEVPK